MGNYLPWGRVPSGHPTTEYQVANPENYTLSYTHRIKQMNIKDNIFVYDCYAYMGAYVLELLVSTEAGKEHRVLWNRSNGCLWAAVCAGK